jgi:hypothetical protein
MLKFPFQFFLSHIVLPDLVEKTKQTYVLLLLDECYCVIDSFDLWMSKGAHDVFALVIIFLEIKLETKTSNSWFIWSC